jgi:hypothetical protein
MRKDIDKAAGSTIYGRLNTVRMPNAEREKALRALKDAELSVDAFAWLTRKIERLAERLFLKPAL